MSGWCWFAAQLPVNITGALGYDGSRYGFAVAIVVALAGFCFRPWRRYGFVLFILGLLFGIVLWVMQAPVPIPLGGRFHISLILFGSPLVISTLCACGFLMGMRRGERRREKADEEERPIASAPRRFGMGTVMIVTVAVSLLFASANWLDLPPAISLFAGSFLAIIGGLQILMNQVPRAASVAAGAVICPLSVWITWTVTGTNPRFAFFVSTPADTAFAMAHMLVVGAVVGYIGGVLVAGLFLVIEMTHQSVLKRHANSPSPSNLT